MSQTSIFQDDLDQSKAATILIIIRPPYTYTAYDFPLIFTHDADSCARDPESRSSNAAMKHYDYRDTSMPKSKSSA